MQEITAVCHWHWLMIYVTLWLTNCLPVSPPVICAQGCIPVIPRQLICINWASGKCSRHGRKYNLYFLAPLWESFPIRSPFLHNITVMGLPSMYYVKLLRNLIYNRFQQNILFCWIPIGETGLGKLRTNFQSMLNATLLLFSISVPVLTSSQLQT